MKYNQYSTCEVHIDLDAIASNYKLLSSIAGKVGPVVKANAYGLGASKVVERLIKDGADTFFVASLEEGIELREHFKDITIYNLLGLYEDPEIYKTHNIIPIINSYNQLKEAKKLHDSTFKVGLQFNTGMSRNGMNYNELEKALSDNLLTDLDIRLVMSHLSSSEEKYNVFNNIQLERFKEFIKHFPKVPKSFANSSGIFLGKEYGFDISRPGIALYGYITEQGIQASVKMLAKILEIHEHSKGEPVGYNQTHILDENKILATIGIGYADGISRAISNIGVVYYGKYKLPILGRVSMDTIIVDITKCVSQIESPYITIFETKEQMLDLASSSQTIPYEILTSIGRRFRFRYNSA